MYSRLRITPGGGAFNTHPSSNPKNQKFIVRQRRNNHNMMKWYKKWDTILCILRNLRCNISSDQFTLASCLRGQLRQRNVAHDIKDRNIRL